MSPHRLVTTLASSGFLAVALVAFPVSTPAMGAPQVVQEDPSGDTGETPRRHRWRDRSFLRDTNAEAVPSIYIVPIAGQLGTDIVSSVYEEIAADIETHDPDVIIFKMNCADIDTNLRAEVFGSVDTEELGRVSLDDNKELVKLFREQLRDTRQVMWVEDSAGMSCILAMAWDELYMMPEARLGGGQMLVLMTGANRWPDENVRGKMMAAMLGIAKGIIEYGEYSPALAEAMLDPARFLTATWEGRTVEWSNDLDGEALLDADDEGCVNFDAKMAEDLCISDGTAETLDDLLLLLGYREYWIAEGQAEEIVTKYVEAWRKIYAKGLEYWGDYQKYRGWATGQDTFKYLARAKTMLEKILMAMRRFDAVETRLQEKTGMSMLAIEIEIEKLNEILRNLRSGGRGASGGGGMLGGGGGGGGNRRGH